MAAMKILITEDSDSHRQMLERILSTKSDHEIITAIDGTSTLETVASEAPDLIILDINLPDMDGFQVYDALKADDSTAKIPIIVLTALGNTASHYGREVPPPDIFLSKPVMPDDLIAQINALLGSS
jgi:DNA-binding response OmpR family regulator